jgi:hypothetical protein
MDENDLVFTNQFIPEPELEEQPDKNEQFRKFYEEETKRIEREKINKDILEKNTTNFTDPTDLANTNSFNQNHIQPVNSSIEERKIKEIVTGVSIDSRDRDKITYLKPNHFKIYLGKTFRQVKMVKLVKIEFPNTDAVINSTNNRIYWRNQEDIDQDIIDNITKTYPVYSVELRIGSYIASTLGSEITDKLDNVKRENKTGDFHYFLVNLDIDTDIVTMTSLILTQLQNNPLSVTAGLGLVTVTANSHGYSTGDIIYMEGVKTVGGIPSSVLGGPQTITVLNPNSIQYEVNVKAGETATGGGNTTKTGKLAPFQLLFGEYSSTVAPNIGYPLENSSQRINSYIKTMVNYYQVRITLTSKHNFTNNIIGQTVFVNGATTTPNIDGFRVVTKIIDDFSFLISVNSKIDFRVFNTGQVEYNSIIYNIALTANNDINTILIETFTNHNFTISNIGDSLKLYNTISVPTFDESTNIYNVISDTLFTIPGEILSGGDVSVSTPGDAGTFPFNNPLTTYTYIISGVVVGNITTITCNGHGLVVGDKVKFYNIETAPSITDNFGGIFTVFNVIDNNTFTIDFLTTAYDVDIITNGLAYIGLQRIKVDFPYHNFNSILSINPVVDLIDPSYNVEITTLLNHNLTTGDSIRVMETTSTPDINGGNYLVKVMSSDTFRIIFPGGITGGGSSGIIGMSNNFFIYGSTGLGGISSNAINNMMYKVKDIIDEHSFTFDCNEFSTKTEDNGGNNVYISSLKHGFNGIQQNTKNSLLNRSINLEGENYSYICCPQLGTMLNTGSVENIFARVTLDQSPGSMVFDFLSYPKTFETPLNELNELEFSIVNYDNSLYEFNDLDYSIVLEITEVVDTFMDSNYNSRTGLNN